jgi:hypothetical protein
MTDADFIYYYGTLGCKYDDRRVRNLTTTIAVYGISGVIQRAGIGAQNLRL